MVTLFQKIRDRFRKSEERFWLFDVRFARIGSTSVKKNSDSVSVQSSKGLAEQLGLCDPAEGTQSSKGCVDQLVVRNLAWGVRIS